ARRAVATLDAVMSAVLGWLEQQIPGESAAAAAAAADGAAASELFLVLLDLFGAVVLPTFRSRYTQFVMFYLCGRDAQYADVFLGTVVGKVGDPARGAAQDAVSGVTRVAAAAYLGSLVARARFLRAPIVRNVVGVLVQWASAYLDWQDEQQRAGGSSSHTEAPGGAKGPGGAMTSGGTVASGSAVARMARSRATSTAHGAGLVPSASQQQRQLQQPVDLERHAVFYAVTQAVLYMFCFRWRDLAEAAGGGPVVESELDNLRWCAELEGLQRVVFSRLNPLRAVAPAVAQQFASVASQTNFMFCYAVLQQNRRADPGGDAAAASSGGGARSGGGGGAAPGARGVPRGAADQMLRARLDSFFPFDPMALPVSRQFIDASYLEWHDVGEALSDADADADADVAATSPTGRRGPGLRIPVDEAGVIDQISAMSVSPAAPLSALPGRDFGSQLRR
ncbi:DNA independent RNA polymerase I transcription factor, partial [Coemansia nantahalensis]